MKREEPRRSLSRREKQGPVRLSAIARAPPSLFFFVLPSFFFPTSFWRGGSCRFSSGFRFPPAQAKREARGRSARGVSGAENERGRVWRRQAKLRRDGDERIAEEKVMLLGRRFSPYSGFLSNPGANKCIDILLVFRTIGACVSVLARHARFPKFAGKRSNSE